MDRNPEVIVVGLGAMGAAVTYQLARRGLKVTGVDRLSPPHDKGSTHGETRITRQAVGEGLDFVPLARRSQELWREIEDAAGVDIFTQCGGLIISRKGQTGSLHGQKDFLGTTIEAATTFGIEHELFDSDVIAKHYPQFALNGDERAYFEPGAGFVRPESAVAAQLELAQKLGAELLTDSEVELVQKNGRTVIRIRGEQFDAGKIVVAAGAWLPKLLPELKPRLSITRQLLYWFRLEGSVSYDPADSPVFIWHWGNGPNDHFYGFPKAGEDQVIKVATEQHDVTTTPDKINRHVSEMEIARMAEKHVVGRLKGVTGSCLKASTCLYTSTSNSRFIVDYLTGAEDVLVVSACSGHGFKHSAAIGEAVAEMIDSGVKPDVLRPFGI